MTLISTSRSFRVSERNPDIHGITVVATRRGEDANPSQYVCEYIVTATKKIETGNDADCVLRAYAPTEAEAGAI